MIGEDTSRQRWHKPLRRRWLLKATATSGAGLTAALAIGCRGEERPVAQPTGQETARRGGTFRYFTFNPGHLDIMTLTYAWTWPVAGVIYNKLAKRTPGEVKMTPDLATWEQPDPETLVFKLPRGVKFHDRPPVNGRELKSSDVVFSLNRLRSPEPIFIHNADYRAIDKVEAPDDVTVRISAKFPDASLITSLGAPQAIIIAPETIDRFGDIKLPDAQIGTGPFMLRDFDLNTGGRFVRHPHYYREGLPYLDGLEIVVTTTPLAWDMFLAGRLDTGDVAREEMAGFDPQARGFIAGPLATRTTEPVTFYPNLQRKPFDDIRVRRALSLILDRREALQNGYPGYPPGHSRLSVALGFHHEPFNLSVEETERLPWGWNPARKREDIREGIQLLETAGFTRDNPLRIEIIGDDDPGTVHGLITGEYMKSYLEKATEGRVQLILRYMQVAAWLGRMARGEYDACFAHFLVGFDVDHALSKIYASDGGRNYGRWRDPEMDRLIARQRSILDLSQRKAAVNEAQRYLADQVPTAPIGWGVQMSVVRNKVRNYAPGQGYEQLEQTWFAG